MTKSKATKTEASTEAVDVALATIPNSPYISTDVVVSSMEVADEMGLGTFDIPQIKVPSAEAGVWATLGVDGQKVHTDTFEGIILAMNPRERGWWAVDYDSRSAEDSVKPACQSMDGKTGFGIREPLPSDDVVATEASCKTCKWAEFGSDRKTGRGQDCSQTGMALVLLPGQAIPHLVRIPASSAKAIVTYTVDLLSSGKKMTQVVTRFGLTDEKNAAGQRYCGVTLEVARATTPDETALVVAAMPQARDLLLRRE